MNFNYTDKQLNELNNGKNVYSVNDEYANRDENQTYTIVNKEDDNLLENEKNMITTSDGQEFRVVATKSDPVQEFDAVSVTIGLIFSILLLFIFKLQQNREKEKSLNEQFHH